MAERRTLLESETEILNKTGKFFGEANSRFAGHPSALLQKTAEKIDFPR